MELFAKARWSGLWTWKLGYAYQGDFDYVFPPYELLNGELVNEDVRGNADVNLAYAAWAPQAEISGKFSLSVAIGAGWQRVDLDEEPDRREIDDGLTTYTKLELYFHTCERFALRTEAGYSFGRDLNVGWIAIGGIYTFSSPRSLFGELRHVRPPICHRQQTPPGDASDA